MEGFRRDSHIWTFASGFSKEDRSSYTWNCPCAVYPGNNLLSVVGNSYYYCESGSVGCPTTTTYYFNDILWDGSGCLNKNCCFDDTTQPWFYRQLNQTTQDDIEARICIASPFNTRSALIDQFELYIQ